MKDLVSVTSILIAGLIFMASGVCVAFLGTKPYTKRDFYLTVALSFLAAMSIIFLIAIAVYLTNNY